MLDEDNNYLASCAVIPGDFSNSRQTGSKVVTVAHRLPAVLPVGFVLISLIINLFIVIFVERMIQIVCVAGD